MPTDISTLSIPPSETPLAASARRVKTWGFLSIAVTGCVLGGILLFGLAGGNAIARFDDNTGEILMAEGKRLEVAGALPEACAAYEKALRARFQNGQNNAFVLKYLGTIEADAKRWDRAVEHLQAALSAPAKPIGAYAPLIESLHALGRTDDARAALEKWRAACTGKNTVERAMNEYWAGVLERDAGDLEAARTHFKASIAHSLGSPAAVELAQMALEQKDRANAIAYALSYLDRGGTGENALRARNIHREATAHTEGPV